MLPFVLTIASSRKCYFLRKKMESMAEEKHTYFSLGIEGDATDYREKQEGGVETSSPRLRLRQKP